MPYWRATVAIFSGEPDTSAVTRAWPLSAKAGNSSSSDSRPRPTTAKPTRCSGGSGAGGGEPGLSASPRQGGKTTLPSCTLPVSTGVGPGRPWAAAVPADSTSPVVVEAPSLSMARRCRAEFIEDGMDRFRTSALG